MTRAALLTLIALLASATAPRAETAAILLLDQLQQRLALEYVYDYRKLDTDRGRTSRYSRHRFEESYGIGVNYAVVDPNILYGRVNIEAIFDQDRLDVAGSGRDSDNFGTGTNLRHDLSGSILHRRPVSMNFHTKLETDRVSRELADSYDVEVFSQGFRVDMKNLYLPAFFDLSRVEMETDGLRRDYSRTSKNFSLGISNRYAISDTNLSLHFFENTSDYDGGEKSHVDAGRFYARNKLDWKTDGKARSLHTAFNYRQETGITGGDIPIDSESANFTELLHWQFGRALEGSVEFNRITDKIPAYTRREKYGRAHLRHQFVQSLTTRAELFGRDISFDGNEEEQLFGKMDFTYIKRLSADDVLNLQYSEMHGTVDRDVASANIQVFAEPHAADLLGQIVLANPNVRAGSVIVRDADGSNRLLPYRLGIDYQIDQIGTLTVISILPGSEILPGTSLLVGYTYIDQADITYEEVARFLAGSVDLDEHRWRLYGNWSKIDRRRRSGDASLVSLRDSRQLTLGAEARRYQGTYGLEYLYFDADYEIRRSLRASLSYWQILAQGTATIGIQDTWSRIEASEFDGAGTTDRRQNSFNISVGWRRSIYGRGLLLLNANYFNTRGDVLSRDEVSLGADYQMIYGKFSLAVESDLRWQFLDEQTIREDYLRLKVTRYF